MHVELKADLLGDDYRVDLQFVNSRGAQLAQRVGLLLRLTGRNGVDRARLVDEIACMRLAAPVIRYMGTFTMEIGNPTWNLENVSFDTPDTRPPEHFNRKSFFTTHSDAVAKDELARLCRDSDGVTTVDPSGINVQRKGGSGSDTLRAGPESTTLRGERGDDILVGNSGHDRLLGQGGDDVLTGGRGRDRLSGGPGDDRMVDLFGPSIVSTGSATGPMGDYVYVRDGRGDDLVRCLTADSTVLADRGDDVRGRCGSVVRTGPIRRPDA
jgi:hypothetical protein